MGFTVLRREGLLAYVLPTPTGGTELVYLVGEPQDHLALRGDNTDEIGDRAVGVDLSERLRPALDGPTDVASKRGV
jgi:hypothetical protein